MPAERSQTAAESTTGISTDADRFRVFSELARFPLGGNLELVYSPFTRTAQTLPTATIRLLLACRTFATLDEHARRLRGELKLGTAQEQPLREQLSGLVQAGLLVSRRDLVARCRHQSSPEEKPPPIAAVGIPTRDRTACLKRCLGSYLENAEQHERRPEWVVIDESTSAERCQSNRLLLQEFQARYRCSLFYAGPEEKTRFVDAIVRAAQVPADVVRFALLGDESCPITTGGSRNTLLLDTVGKLALQLDDDTICTPMPAPHQRYGLSCTSQFDPTEIWFLAESDPPIPKTAAEDKDLLAIHEQMLGKSLVDCLETLDPEVEIDFDRVESRFFPKQGGPGGKVRITTVGVQGDSGMSSSLYFLALDGPARARLLASEAGYRHALARHQLIRAVTRPTISDGGLCQAMNLGLDNRQLLPPFMPVQRNQDGIFAALVRKCLPSAYFGYLPWMIVHNAPVARQFVRADLWRSVAGAPSGQIIQTLIWSLVLGPDKASPAKNLQEVGRALAEWGSASLADFEEWVRFHLWTQMSRQAVQLENQLREVGDQCVFWRNDVNEVLAALREALPTDHYPVPRDLADFYGINEARRRFQQLMVQWGQLLRVWPDLVESARDLRSQGVRPTIPLG